MADYVYDFDPADTNNTAAAVFRFALRDAGGADGSGGRVLDLGSGPGIVSGRLAREHGRDVVCVDVSADSLKLAAEAGVRTVLANIEDPASLEQFKGEAFDVVIVADVLEHLRDPGAVLVQLLRQRVIAESGALVVSFPNVIHEAVLAELAAGKFEYTETGLLDRTHVRFFTLESLRALLEGSGFLVESVHRTTRTLEQTQQRQRRDELPPGGREWIAGLGGEHRTFQYVLLARPSSATGQLAALRQELAEQAAAHTAQLDELTSRLARHRRDAERIGELERLLAAERALALRRLDEIAKLRRRSLAEQKKIVRRYEKSTTWRIGKVIATLGRPRQLAGALRRRRGRGTDATESDRT